MNEDLARQPSLQKTFEEAVRHHQAGRLAEATRLYQDVLAVAPGHVDSLHLLGLAHYHSGRLESAAALIQNAIQRKPDVPSFHNNLGCVLNDQGQAEAAAQSFDRAIALSPDYAEAHNNLGNALKAGGKPERAAVAYERALALKPDYAEAHYNLGCVLKDLKRHDAALECFSRAVFSKPDYAEAQNNLGNMLVETGELDEAGGSYEKALALRPHDTTIRYNLMALRYMTTPVESWKAIGEGFLQETALPAPHAHEIFVRQAIHFWHKGDLDQLGKTLNRCRELSMAIGPSDDINVKNMRAYQVFLEKLLEHSKAFPRQELPLPCGAIAIIGDSHCLSYANAVLEWKGKPHAVSSHLIVGCKAWHLAGHTPNRYSWRLNTIMERLSPGTFCLFSFGEIDCRVDEGIMAHWRKNGGDLSGIVASTAADYVRNVSETAARQRLKPAFINVPAPDTEGLAKNGQRVSPEAGQTAITVVRLFNEVLEKEAEERGASVIDVYQLSVGLDGKSNGRYHLDQRHLKPEALAAAAGGVQ